MSQALTISAIDYCRPQKLHELDNFQLQALPVSSYQLPDGTYHVISQYRDNTWRLEDMRFPSSTMDSKKKLRFDTLPSQFVEAVKFALKHYDIKYNPSGSTLVDALHKLTPFLNYLDSINVKSTAEITPLLCANYVHQCKQSISKTTQKPLSKGALMQRFLAIERLYHNLSGTQWAFENPWVESSASYLAGTTGQGKRTAKTKIIPDGELKVLINYCNTILELASDLIKLKAEVVRERDVLTKTGSSKSKIRDAVINRLLKPRGYAELREFNALYESIPNAMAIIILTFSGVRIHELCAIQADAYRIEDNEEDIYYWLKSHSRKTDEGYTEWLVPEIVIKAIEVQKAYVKPLRERLLEEQSALLTKDPYDPRGLKIEHFKHHLF